MNPPADSEPFLSGPLLSEVDDESRRSLYHALEPLQVVAGAVLIEQGRPNDRLWFFTLGTVAIVRREHGVDRVIADLSAPGIFGATSFFRPAPPIVSVRASSDMTLLTLDHAAHNRLRRDHPKAAEGLALATVRVLAERFDLLDARISEFMASHVDDHRKTNEWAGFRARLFEEPNIV